MKNRRTTITGLLALILVFECEQLLGGYAEHARPARHPSHQRIVRLMDSHHGNHKGGVTTEPAADNGNNEAIRDLLNKECEVAVTSRKMLREEIREAENRGMEIKEAISGWAGIAVAVHPTNPVNELAVDQVCKIMAGEYTMWNEVGGTTHPISIARGGKYWTEMVDYFAQTFVNARLVQMALQTKHFSEEPNAVTLTRFDDTGCGTKTKILAIKKDEQSQAILPSKETVDCGTYPFRQPLYVYVDWKNATDATKAFFNFCANQAVRTPCK